MSDTRTWKCPECERSEEIGYDWLAEHGAPICQQCDCDMALQPKMEPNASQCDSEVEHPSTPGVRDGRGNSMTVRRWVLYDFDADILLTTHVYDSYEAAAEDASQANDVLILPLVCNIIHAGNGI